MNYRYLHLHAFLFIFLIFISVLLITEYSYASIDEFWGAYETIQEQTNFGVLTYTYPSVIISGMIANISVVLEPLPESVVSGKLLLKTGRNYSDTVLSSSDYLLEGQWYDKPVETTPYAILLTTAAQEIILATFDISVMQSTTNMTPVACGDSFCDFGTYCFLNECVFCTGSYQHIVNTLCQWDCPLNTIPDETTASCICAEGYVFSHYDTDQRIVCKLKEDVFAEPLLVYEGESCDAVVSVCAKGLICDTGFCKLQQEPINVSEEQQKLRFNTPTEVIKNTSFYAELNYELSITASNKLEQHDFFIRSERGEKLLPITQQQTSTTAYYARWKIPFIDTTMYKLYIITSNATTTISEHLLHNFTIKTKEELVANSEEHLENETFEDLSTIIYQTNTSANLSSFKEELFAKDITPLKTNNASAQPQNETFEELQTKTRLLARNEYLEEELTQAKEQRIILRKSITQELFLENDTKQQLAQEEARRVINIREQEEVNFEDRKERAEQLFSTTKEITLKEITMQNDQRFLATEIKLIVIPKENETTVAVVEVIPKEIAEHVSEIAFNKAPIILEEDPVIMWHLEDVTEPVELTYTVAKNVSLTGNTILLAEPVESFDWSLLLPLLFIPLLASIFIFINHFHNKEE